MGGIDGWMSIWIDLIVSSSRRRVLKTKCKFSTQNPAVMCCTWFLLGQWGATHSGFGAPRAMVPPVSRDYNYVVPAVVSSAPATFSSSSRPCLDSTSWLRRNILFRPRRYFTNLESLKLILLIIMACNVVVTDEESLNRVGFLDLQPVNTIEALLSEACCLTHPI